MGVSCQVLVGQPRAGAQVRGGLGWAWARDFRSQVESPLPREKKNCLRFCCSCCQQPTANNHPKRNRGSPDGPEYLIEVPPAQPSAPQVPLDKGCIPSLHACTSARRGESGGDLPVLCVSLSVSPALAAHHGYLQLGVLGQILPVWYQS